MNNSKGFYGDFSEQQLLDKLNQKFEKVGLPTIACIEDIYSIPIQTKEDCQFDSIGEILNSLESNSQDGFVLLGSGGTTKATPSMTLQSLEEFLFEAKIIANLIENLLQRKGIINKVGFVNLISAGGLWGGGYLGFLSSSSSNQFIGINPANRPIKDMAEIVLKAYLSIDKNIDGLVLFGVASTIQDFANECIKQELNFPVISAVFGGEGLTEKANQDILKAFPNCSIHGYYSSSEGCCMGFSEKVGQQRVSRVVPESSFIWIADENDNPIKEINQEGRVIVTNLYTRFKPVNFATNDIAVWREYNQKFEVKGRASNIVSFPSLRFPADAAVNLIAKYTNANTVQLKLEDKKICVILDKADCLPSIDEVFEMFFQAAGLPAPHVKEQIRICFEVGEDKISVTKNLKKPLLIDNRSV